MEVNPDCNVMQHKRRLCKHSGQRWRAKIEFIIQGPVILDLPLTHNSLADTISIRENLERQFFRCHYADIQKSLATSQSFQHLRLDILCHRNLFHHLRKQLR